MDGPNFKEEIEIMASLIETLQCGEKVKEME